MSKARLYLIPVPLAEDALHTIPEAVKNTTVSIRHYFVENIRTARRYLKSIDKDVDIDAIHFSEVNNQTVPDLSLLKKWVKEGHAIGVMSEAGCPGVADPGSKLVEAAHRLHAQVTPLTGPSSVLLALMASGFNGQAFRFIGYLPVKEPLRSKTIKELEAIAIKKNETQIFIETPYRNNQLLEGLLKQCEPSTQLCIAAHITAAQEIIRTMRIAEWKKQVPDLHKQPVIFLMMG